MVFRKLALDAVNRALTTLDGIVAYLAAKTG